MNGFEQIGNGDIQPSEQFEDSDKVALAKYDTYRKSMAAAATTGDIIHALEEFAVYEKDLGGEVVYTFVDEGEGLESDGAAPLAPLIAALNEYTRGEISAQQLYAKTLGYLVVSDVERVIGEAMDNETVIKLAHAGHEDYIEGELQRKNPGVTFEGTIAPPEIDQEK